MKIVNVKRVSPVGWEVITDAGKKYHANMMVDGNLSRAWTPPTPISPDGELGRKIEAAIRKASPSSNALRTGDARRID